MLPVWIRRSPQTLTDAADLLSAVQAAPLVRDGLQHLLQGSVQLPVLLLRGPDSLTQTGEGRHLRAGIMTVRANSFRRHRLTANGQEYAPALPLIYPGTTLSSRRKGAAGGRDRRALLRCPKKAQTGRTAEGDSGPPVVQISWKHPSHFL